MARSQITEVVVNNTGALLSNITCDVYDARTTNHSTIFQNESGGAVITNPQLTSNGAVAGWLNEGEYDLAFSGVGITPYTRRFNVLKGGNPLLLPGQVTNTELAALSVNTGNLIDGSITAPKLAANAVSSAAVANNTLPWAKMLGTNVQPQLGVNDGTTVSRGKSYVSGSESRTNTAYGLLTTPDRVQNVVVPTGGLLFVAYQALWGESVSGAARAAIFLGSNQLKVQADGSGSPAALTQAAVLNNAGGSLNEPLVSCPVGLISPSSGGFSATADVTTGQAVGAIAIAGTPSNLIESGGSSRALVPASTDSVVAGGACVIFGDPANPMTVDVSVQFKASSGSVAAVNRKLWVWTVGF